MTFANRDSVDPRDHHGLALHLAHKAWRRYQWRNVEMCDVEQEAFVALYTCVATYDPAKGRFASFAGKSINGRLLSFRGRTTRIVHFGGASRTAEIHKRLRRFRGAITPDAVQDALRDVNGYGQLTEMEACRAVWFAKGYDVGFDDLFLPGDNLTYGDIIRDEDDEQIERDAAQSEWRPIVARILSECMDDPHPAVRAILERRIMADEPEDLAEIGRAVGLSRERIRQLETRLLIGLREKLERAGMLAKTTR